MNLAKALRPLFVRAAKHGLGEVFPPTAMGEVIDAAFAEYETQRPRIPKQPSRGGQMMVHAAALTIGLYRVLLARNIEESRAGALTAQVTAAIYEKMAVAPTLVSRIGDPRKGLRRATRLFRTFPFSAPSYQMVDRPSSQDVVAFDVLRCPVADYFVSEGLGALCKASWCDLDYPLARRWGSTLVRTTTIAEGQDHCDFRWHVETDS